MLTKRSLHSKTRTCETKKTVYSYSSNKFTPQSQTHLPIRE